MIDLTQPCEIWDGPVNGKYGYICTDGDTFWVHRWVMDCPKGMEVDHLCRVTLCINKAHLEIVTPAENRRRAKAMITACPQGHPYDQANTHITRAGSRQCRACRRRWRTKGKNT